MRSWSKASAGAAAGSVTRTARASSPAAAETDVEPGFLLRLAHGRRLDRLADVDEAARQRVAERRVMALDQHDRPSGPVLEFDHDDFLMPEAIDEAEKAFADGAVDFRALPMQAAFTQGCYSTTLDELVDAGALPVPNHIKIDVDGIEHKVVGGALRTLENPALRSLIIETNPALIEHRQMISMLKQFGFALDHHQIARATRADGPFKGVAEHVFRR